MTKQDFENIAKQMQEYAEKLKGNKEASREFLQSAGIIDKKGKLTKPFKYLCIPQN